MTDILSLSDLDLRKEVAGAKDYTVQPLPRNAWDTVTYYVLFNPKNGYIGTRYDNPELCWNEAPKFESLIADSFPLVSEMYDMGWNVHLDWYHDEDDGSKTLSVWCDKDDDPSKFNQVPSSSDTDPSDAIAKCYLLVRKEMSK